MLLRMQAELLYFALSVAAGALAALFGSGMKWLHRRRRLAIWLGFLDLLYWFLLGFSLFLLCFYQNSGIFRGYAAVGTLMGYGMVRGLIGCLEKRFDQKRSKIRKKKKSIEKEKDKSAEEKKKKKRKKEKEE